MKWYDMIDMIWYDMILFAQNRGPKAELQCTICDKKEKKHTHSMTRNNNRQQRNKAKLLTVTNRPTVKDVILNLQ